MIKMLELREMIRLVNTSSIQEFCLKNNGVKISMKKPLLKVSEFPEENIQMPFNKVTAPLEQEPQNSTSIEPKGEEEEKKASLHEISSPWIGVLALSTEKNLVVGDQITKGTVLGQCKVEELDLNHEITSDVHGIIADIHVGNGQIIGYGQPLFTINVEEGE